MFLDQEERPIRLCLDFSHVPLIRTQSRQRFHALLQGVLAGYLLAIGSNLLVRAHV